MDKEEVIDLIKDAGFGMLATVEGGQPRVRPMMPYLTEEGELLLALLSRSRTIEQVKENPHVEFCFVDRKMWYCRITGDARIDDNPDHKALLWNNLPMLKQYFGGPEDPNFVLCQIDIKEVEAMTPQGQMPETISMSSA